MRQDGQIFWTDMRDIEGNTLEPAWYNIKPSFDWKLVVYPIDQRPH